MSDEGGGGGHDGSGGMRWLLTYADLITLLMAFFIIMYAMSDLDKEKYAQVAASLRVALGGGGGSLVVVGQGGGDAKLPKDLQEKFEATEAAKEAARQSEQPTIQIRPGAKAQGDQELLELGQQIVADLKTHGRFHVYSNERGVVISLLGSALFDSGQAVIRPQAQPLLATIAERLRSVPNDVSVEGSADDRPINTPEFPSNWELSSRRATEVVRYLVEQHQLDSRRFIVVGYGDMRPVFDNSTAEGRANNRRVDLVILKDRHTVILGEELK